MALLERRAPCTWIATSTACCATSVAYSFAIADALRTGRTPASYCAAASRTSRRAACTGRHLGELVRDGLELGERPAERFPRGGVRDGGVERRLRHPDAEGSDTRPEEIERFHRDLEATVDLAEHLHGLDADAVEVEPPDRVRRDQLDCLARKPVALARDREGSDPRTSSRTRCRCPRPGR